MYNNIHLFTISIIARQSKKIIRIFSYNTLFFAFFITMRKYIYSKDVLTNTCKKKKQPLIQSIQAYYMRCKDYKNYCDSYLFDIDTVLSRFIEFMNLRWKIYTSDIMLEDIELFVWFCRKIRIDKSSRYFWQQEYLSWSTVSQHLSVVRCFIKYCNTRNIVTLNPSSIENVKYHRPKIQVFDDKELQQLFHCSHEFEDRPATRIRNEIFIKMLYYTWCRISEIIDIKFSDIKDNTNQLQILGKWWKIRGVMITDEIKWLIRKYKSMRETDRTFRWRIVVDKYNTDNIFVSHGEMTYWLPCTIRTFQDMFARYKIWLWRNRPLTAHILRHTFATNMMHKWWDVRVVQIMLWHTELSTTMRYTHVSDALIQKTHELLLK